MADTPFQVEAWVEYGLGVLILLIRFFARWSAVGFQGRQGDDYFAVAALIFWTLLLVTAELIGQNGTNVGLNDEIAATLSDEEISKREFGSKVLLAGWVAYVSLIWSLKGCMLFFFNRITLGLKQQKFIKWAGLACAMTYVAVIAVVFGHCTPILKKWQIIPYPGGNVLFPAAVLDSWLRIFGGTIFYLTVAALNVFTDILIVYIPLPLLWKVNLILPRKIAIGVLLCSGVFIMVATLLHCIESIKDIEGIGTSTIWGIRETFVGIIAVNAPAIKPLFTRSRWLKGSRSGGSSTRPSGHTYLHSSSRDPSHMLQTLSGRKTAETMPGHNNSSEEMIVTKHGPEFQSNVAVEALDSPPVSGNKVIITTTFQVEVEQDNGSWKNA
ncbi:hypothetical protein SAPIO_CDS2254 [Scedosporium apiospermum]|uniref:Rhodopsin domain-containing protein n=1 Tax=Pseudallescheria apiosperma TaxID=563466 RepID=A0A084GC45_PSEDA|nr:uncharacterized protein SAPIO_CDS2254 [Scedosporium apiospermum]KEZ44907.1 hypothetical protein SAPIO_CDS2254 [Scedosporium apiospermum]